MRYEDVYKMKKQSLEECLALIENGDTIAVSGVATEPTEFLSHFTEIVPRLRDVTIIKSKDNEYEYLRSGHKGPRHVRRPLLRQEHAGGP